MKHKVELLNCLIYKNKDGGQSVRLGYRLLDPSFNQDTAKFKGYSEMSYFGDNIDLFSKLRKEHFGVPCELETEERPNLSNPLKKVIVLKSLHVANEHLSLL